MEQATISWRQDLDLSIDQIKVRKAQAAARLAELDAALAEIEPRLKSARGRLAEAGTAVTTGPAKLETLKTDAAEGRCTLDDVVTAQVHMEMARDLLPKIRGYCRELEMDVSSIVRAQGRVRREPPALAAAEAWKDLQSALAPAHDAIAAWLHLTGDAAVYIAAPSDRG